MDVSRQMALEIFGLGENFTEEEVNKNFRKLAKIVHPDTGGDKNLLKFIMCCKKTLEESEPGESKKDSKKKAAVRLSTLYSICFSNKLSEILDKYDISYIRGKAKIFITPLPSQSRHSFLFMFEPIEHKINCESTVIEFSQPFSEFQYLNFANYYLRPGWFNSVIELTFEF